MVIEPQHLAFGVIDPIDGFDRYALAILEHNQGADVFQLQDFGFGEILGGSTSGKFIGPRIGSEAVEPRQFHDDLGARQRNLAGIDRESRDQTERIEECCDDEDGYDRRDAGRNCKAQKTDKTTVPRRGTEHAVAVAPPDLTRRARGWRTNNRIIIQTITSQDRSAKTQLTSGIIAHHL